MAEKPALNPETPRRRRGRPSRKEEVQRALAELGVDPATIDPRRVLAAIAGDTNAPAGARVAACKVLLGVKDQDPAEDVASSDVASRAIRLMAARKAH
jgi:hypothetical protein